MDALRNFLTGRSDGDSDAADYDENIQNGPTIHLSPGQVKEDVHYMESRGSIDLSYLRFYSDDYSSSQQNQIEINKSDAVEKESDINENSSYGSVQWKESFLDIAVFEVPEHCTSRNCDLSKV